MSTLVLYVDQYTNIEDSEININPSPVLSTH